MNNTIKILTLIILFSSCRTDVNQDENLNTVNDTIIDTEPATHKFLSVTFNETEEETEHVKWQQIQFTDLTILLEKIDMGWHKMYLTGNDSVYKTTSDTAYFDLWPGDWFFDKAFKVKQSEYDQVELYESVTYNMAINSNRVIEVPFCVMNGWKTFQSEWSKIRLEKGKLNFNSNEESINAKIDFTIDEFKNAVKEHCGIEWYNEIKKVESIDKLRSELFTSSYTFKIVARSSKTGAKIEKFIVFNTPVSC